MIRLLPLAGALLCAGCLGAVEESVAPAPDPVPAAAPKPVAMPGAAPAADAPPPRTTDRAARGPAAGRRLTREEYLNTVADVLGVDPAPLRRLVPEDAPSGTTGFRNAADAQTPSEVRTAAYESAATQIAAAARWSAHAPCTDATAACQAGFVRRVGRLLYRRPLGDAELQNLARLFAAAQGEPFEVGARLVIQAMLQSPHFLYRLERADRPLSPFELATRLSFALWKSAPNEPLLAAAEQGRLASEAGLREALETMLRDPRARRGLRDFVEDWIQLYRLDERAPDPRFGITAELLRDMREETQRFVARLALDEGADLTALFTSERTELTPALAKVYGVTAAGTGWRPHDTAGDPRRMGILTQPAVLAVHAGVEHASIVDRGLVVLRTFLCADVPTPPDSVLTQFKPVPETLTDRERFAIHGESPTCAGCHRLIDPLGHPFEPYDVVGRHRVRDHHGNPLRDDGVVELDGAARPYRNAEEFATLLGRSQAVERCLQAKVLAHALGRAVGDQDEPAVEAIERAFRAGGRTWRALALAVGTSPALRAPAHP